jgi:hypothetical protein
MADSWRWTARHARLLFVTLVVPERCEVAPNEPASLSPLSPRQ